MDNLQDKWNKRWASRRKNAKKVAKKLSYKPIKLKKARSYIKEVFDNV